jgi:hypothetical protein
MIALEAQTDFLCVVYERNDKQTEEGEDCEEHYLKSPIHVEVPGFRGSTQLDEGTKKRKQESS